MIESPVVFVLGAGASICYGFPSGRDLLLDVVDMVNELTRFPNSDESWHQIPFPQLRTFAQELLDSQLPSVDQFIESRPTYDRIGRVLIARTLIPKEMALAISRRRVKKDLNSDNRVSTQRWLEYLYSYMAAPTVDLFLEKNRVSFVTFNYDRVVEQFFFTALQRSHGLSNEQALALVRGMNIVHVYGTLGKFALDFDDNENARPFTHEVTPQAVDIAADAIRILADHREGFSPEFTQAHELLAAAAKVCFLGFGYLPTNAARLLPTGVCEALALTRSLSNRRMGKKTIVFGTAYGLGDAERFRATKVIPLGLELADRGANCLDCLQAFPLF